ncbi:putative acetolactate synthase small subunit [Rubripirellula reticaptiva]|uniref:acetolactate synthase n=2 Tax=Rubripirellula reticaptiva TaxID=2528013 RepID=A0A5C6F8Y8_9BACT|nr:putative acetolactate synthase small subunit [Rubripirellula reticaptiva]
MKRDRPEVYRKLTGPKSQPLLDLEAKIMMPRFGRFPDRLHSSPEPIFRPLMSQSNQRHVLSALVQNVPGVLAHISGMLASRGFNIDSLAVGETDDVLLSRMTFVVVGDDQVLEQVGKQLEKIVTVVKVLDVSSSDFVERDLLLLKVKAPAGSARSEIRELVDIFRGQIVDVGPEEVMIEISGRETKVQAFIERMRSYGITELVRTGRIAMVRSGNESSAIDESESRFAS